MGAQAWRVFQENTGAVDRTLALFSQLGSGSSHV
jgi:hypothetical protein